ncbi:hypothetical protein LCL87_25490, partial [Rhodococcus hoagii]|nr:hypothetical protein [Prescottella equi]
PKAPTIFGGGLRHFCVFFRGARRSGATTRSAEPLGAFGVLESVQHQREILDEAGARSRAPVSGSIDPTEGPSVAALK